MPCKQSKAAKKPARKPKNTRETENKDLDKYIIRTRRQSKQQENSQALMTMAEFTQPCQEGNSHEECPNTATAPTMNKESSLEKIRQDFKASSEIIETQLQTVFKGATQRNNTSSKCDNAHVETSLESVSLNKGKVAEIVDKLNHTPATSPVTSPCPTPRNTSRINLSMENLASTGCPNGDHHVQQMNLGEVLKDLTQTSKTLNNSVSQLQQELASLRTQKDQQEKQVSDLISTQKAESKRLQQALEIIEEHEQRFQAVVGIMTRQNHEIASLKKILNNMAVKSMKHNVIVSGIEEERNENPTWKVLEFFKSQLKIKDNIQVSRAYRVGQGTDRPLVAELARIEDKAKIYANVSNLKGVKNSKKRPYFVSDQLPDDYAEKKRQESFVKSQNNKLPVAQQLNMSFKKGDLYVQGSKFQPPIHEPTIQQLVLPNEQEKATTQATEIFEGDTRDLQYSTFVGYAARVKKMEQVNRAYRAVRKKHPNATHVMCAFRFPGTNPTKSFGMADDGENGGARKILSIMNNERLFNMAVFVVRYYGGVNLGSDRFSFIETVAKSAIAEVLDSERPESTPWDQQDEFEQLQPWADTEPPGPFDENTEGLPNEGRALPQRSVQTESAISTLEDDDRSTQGSLH